jgi:DNA-binding NarL/FixJ family response regulator
VAERIRVSIVEDHQMVREGFQAVIDGAPDMEVVGAAATFADAGPMLRTSRPDVVLCDFVLPDGSGADITPLAADVGAQVLIVTGADDLRAVEAAIATGCSGFVSKGKSSASLLESIRQVASGAAVFPANLLAAVTQGTNEPKPTDLTKRELEILGLLAQARNADEIAKELYLSVHTVRNHIRAVLTKLEARSQLEALVIGIRLGLVTVSTEIEP